MERFRTSLLALSMLTLVPGCPSSTTLEIDTGTVDAAHGADAAVDDTGVPVDAAPGVDSGVVDVDGGAAPRWDTCTATSECTLAPAGCCEPCGTPVLADYDGVNAMQTDAHFADVCPTPTPCPRCATGVNPDLVATCAAGHCRAVDVSMEALSACNVDGDCIVRYANCCGCSGTVDEVVSIRRDAEGAIEGLLCDGGGCAADCAPRPDPGFRAACDPTTMHCAAIPLTP